ncbi:MAG: phage baseplate assembly protein [Pseudomonadota bacterium]
MRETGLTRFSFDGTVDHRGGQQFVNGRGFAGDDFRNVFRPEPHGFASHPVKGGQGLVLQSRGARDAGYVMGGENPQMRPSLTPGASALYDQNGHILKVFDDGMVLDVKGKSITMSAGSGYTLTGDVRIEGALHVTGNITTDSTNPNAHSH